MKLKTLYRDTDVKANLFGVCWGADSETLYWNIKDSMSADVYWYLDATLWIPLAAHVDRRRAGIENQLKEEMA